MTWRVVETIYDHRGQGVVVVPEGAEYPQYRFLVKPHQTPAQEPYARLRIEVRYDETYVWGEMTEMPRSLFKCLARMLMTLEASYPEDFCSACSVAFKEGSIQSRGSSG